MLTILRKTVRTLERIVLLLGAYEYHCRANRAVSQLRLHSDADLKDLGLHKSMIYEAAHRGCGWCHPKSTEVGQGYTGTRKKTDGDLG